MNNCSIDTLNRCINLDWLEVHCLEPPSQPRNAEFFRQLGFVVREREYGTRVYKEMFTLDDSKGIPFLEVRRNPASQGIGGIHLAEECHLRLTNRACYLDDAAHIMADFIETYGYTFNRISRVDICLDFEYFDTGDDPQTFLRRYMKQRYAKINQGNIHAHGSESWSSLNWNSVSWGAPSSDIGTKFYNKTLELYNPHDGSYSKPYIRWAWHKCGLVDNPTLMTKERNGQSYTPQIWRVEFSIRSSVKKWFVIELNGKQKDYQSIRNTLDQYDSREKLLTLFASLTQHYFHFKYLLKTYSFYKEGHTSGKAIRKDRCPDKQLFRWNGQQFVYKVGRDDTKIGRGEKQVHPLNSLIQKLKYYQSTHFAPDIHRACQVLIEAMESESIRSDMAHPWSREELLALQLALKHQTEHPTADVAILLKEIKALLHLNDNTAPF